MAFIGFRVSDDLAARLDAFAANRGGRSSALRRLIEAATAGEGSAPAAVVGERSASAKVTIRLKPEDLAPLDAAAGEAGFRRTEWIVALIRRRLTRRPQYSRDEALALISVQRELRRIGVNLNQIARAMNTAVMPGSVLETEVREIQSLAGEVRGHIRGLRGAFEGNLAYWDDAA